MVRIGIAGVGFMGMVHFLTYEKLRGAKVVAICDPKRKRLRGDWREIKGNFGPAGSQVDLQGIFTTPDWQELIERSEIDLIDICVPPANHAEIAIEAMRAGKHVFCEKPISLQLNEARRMVRAASSTNRQLLVGHVLPLFPEYAFALDAAKKQKYGRLLGGHFKRVISDPKWLPNFYDPDQVGGPLFDLHIHDAHFIRLMFGMPTHVSSCGRMRGAVPEYFSTQFQFSDPALAVTATSGVIHQPSRSFLHGYEIHFERATLLFEFAQLDNKPTVITPLTVLRNKGKSQRPKLSDGDPMQAFDAELKAVLRGVSTGEIDPFLQCEPALDAVRICHRQRDSLSKRSRVAIKA